MPKYITLQLPMCQDFKPCGIISFTDGIAAQGLEFSPYSKRINSPSIGDVKAVAPLFVGSP